MTLLPIALACAPRAQAATIYTYTYTGNDFQYVTPPYTTSDFVTVTFTLSAPLGDNLSNEGEGFGTQVTPLDWSFSDGVQTHTSADPDPGPDSGASLYFTTNGSGTILYWQVLDTFGADSLQIVSLSGANGYSYDVGATNHGDPSDEIDNPGVWSVSESPSPSSAPEGPSFAFLLLGLASFGGLALFNARRRAAASARAREPLQAEG